LVKAFFVAEKHSEPWSRSNLTRTYFTHQLQSQAKSPKSKPGNIVLSRNVSAKVLFEHSKSLAGPETFSRQCRPRFSFFCIKLSKNRQSQNRRKLNHPKTIPQPISQTKQTIKPVSPNLVCAPSQRCRVSRTLSKPCQPIFFKKFTTLSVDPLSIHQPNSHPINAADLNKVNFNVNSFKPTTRTKLSAASSVAALVERHIDPTQQNCQRLIRKNANFSFHRQTKTILPNLNQTNHHDSFNPITSPSQSGLACN